MAATTKKYDFVKDIIDGQKHEKFYVYNMQIQGIKISMRLKSRRVWWDIDWYDTDTLYFWVNCE